VSIKARDLLKSHALRLTDARVEVIDFIIDHHRAVSQPELEHALVHKYDRVTLYRTLNTLSEHGILHPIADNSGTMKYALCTDACSSEAHYHEHLHFHCIQCLETVCLDGINLTRPALPAGYQAHDYNFVVNGKCNKCN
jgi:Fur family ferric uptake transcriptional regulator